MKESHRNAERTIVSLVSFIFLVVISLSFLSAASYLNGTKAVSPNILYVGDNATITLTVNGSGSAENITQSLDVILLIDNSCSVSSSELATERSAAKTLVSVLSNGLNRIGVTSFNEYPSIRLGLTNNYTSVNSTIGKITTRADCTNIGAAIKSAYEQFNYSSDSKKVIVLISDGQANWPKDNYIQYAIDQANIARQKGVVIYTVGVGNEINQDLLKKIANDKVTGSYHYYTNNAQLAANFGSIFSSISSRTNNLAGENIIITDVLAAGVTPILLPSECVYNVNNREVICDAGKLNIGESRSFSFRVAVYNSSLNHLNEVAYVNYTNYLGNSSSFILNNPNVTVLERENVCTNNVAPVITIVSPTNRVYNNSIVRVGVNATDNNLENIWYNLNGTNVSYISSFDVNLSNNNYRLYAYANDSCGKISSTFVDFAVNFSGNPNVHDTVGPNVTINSPLAVVYNNCSVRFNITAIDDVAVDKIWYSLNGISYSYGGSFIRCLSNGNYTLTAYANDSSGNIGSASVSFRVNLSGSDESCKSCGGHTRAPVNDFDSSETADSISIDNEVIVLNLSNSTQIEDSHSEDYLSGGFNRLIFNMILLIAIIILLLLIVLVGRDNKAYK